MPIDIFESFYKQCISDLDVLTEDKANSNRKNVPVVVRDSVDLKMRSEILSPENNELKTESILAFFLGDEMWNYVTERCVNKIRSFHETTDLYENCSINPLFKKHFMNFFEKVLEHNASKPNAGPVPRDKWGAFVSLSSNPNVMKALYDKFRAFSDYKEYKKDVATLNKKDTKQSAEDTMFIFCKMGILGQKNNNFYRKDSDVSRNFYDNGNEDKSRDVCVSLAAYDRENLIKLIDSTKFDPGRRLSYTDSTDFKKLFDWFKTNGLVDAANNKLIDVPTALKYFVDAGIPQSKLRNCPAFTYELNNNEEYQTSRGYINSPMANVLRPSKLQAQTVRGFVGETMAKALGRASQDIYNAAYSVAAIGDDENIKIHIGDYEHAKIREASVIPGILSSEISTVADFYNKFSRILNLGGDFGEYDKKDFVAARNTENTNTLNALKEADEIIDSAKKTIEKALTDLPPVFADIITQTMVMFGHRVSTQPHDNASMYSFKNPDTGKWMNFIVPTENLAAAIDKERYRNTFSELDEYSTQVGKQRMMTTLVVDTMMTPDEMVVGPGNNIKITNLQSAEEKMKELFRKISSLGEKETPTANFVKKYYVDQNSIYEFRKMLEKNGGLITVKSGNESLNVGTYANEHANTNVTVEFVHQNASAKNVWARTEMVVQNYYSGQPSNTVAASVRIRTPISAIDAEKSIMASEVDRNKENKKTLMPSKFMEEIGESKINSILASDDPIETKTRNLLQLMLETALRIKIERDYSDKSEISHTLLDSAAAFSRYFCSPSHLVVQIPREIDENYLKTMFFPVVTTILNATWPVLVYGVMYTNMVWNSDVSFDDPSVDPSSETTMDEIMSELQKICVETKDNFSSSVGKSTHRSMNAAFIANTEDDSMINFWQTQNPNNALKTILNKVVLSSELFAESRMASNYVRSKMMNGTKSEIDAAAKAIQRLDNLVGAAAGMAAYPSLMNQIMIPKISMPSVIESLNNIGKAYVDVVKSIAMDPKAFNFNLSFKECMEQFASVLKAVNDDSTLNLGDKFFGDSVSRLIKLYFEGTYLMYLSIAMSKPGFQERVGSRKDIPVFPLVTQMKTPRASDTTNSLPETPNVNPLTQWSGWNPAVDRGFDIDS